MTKGELFLIEKRIDEIDSILELCIDRKDDDVIHSLHNELDYYINKLENLNEQSIIRP